MVDQNNLVRSLCLEKEKYLINKYFGNLIIEASNLRPETIDEYSDNSTHPVGEKKPNELGLFDMSGNVWEWTETPAHSYAIQIERTSLLDEITTFIRRGGSWWHEAKNCRVSRRYASDHTKKTNGLGLRVVIRENVM